jgi:N-acetylmuramoyl-L-alanine amidase CwlA
VGVGGLYAKDWVERTNSGQLNNSACPHYFIDNKDIIWVLPDYYTGYHTGKKNESNINSIGIEMAEPFFDNNVFKGKKKASLQATAYAKEVYEKKLVPLCAYYCIRQGIPVANVKTHYQWGMEGKATRSGDPDESLWRGTNYNTKKLQQDVQAYIDKLLGKEILNKTVVKEELKKKEHKKDQKKADKTDIYSLRGGPTIDKKTMLAWAMSRAADKKMAEKIVNYYYEKASKLGINPSFAVAQSAFEAGRKTERRTLFWDSDIFLKLNNPAGIKIKDPKGDKFSDFQKFENVEQGIEAHISHIAYYNGIESSLYIAPRTERWREIIFGKGKTLKDFCGKYATDGSYERNIKSLMREASAYSLEKSF